MGIWVNNRDFGRGIMVFRVQKFGTFVWPMKGEYTGEWNGPHMEGEGTFRTATGEIYEGTQKL